MICNMDSVKDPTLATEAIRAFFTLQCCWLNDEEMYLEGSCQHCGSAATYLIYFTNPAIQKLLLSFIAKYNCIHNKYTDLLDLPEFEKNYNFFLQQLESEVNCYARQTQHVIRKISFENIHSIFGRVSAIAC